MAENMLALTVKPVAKFRNCHNDEHTQCRQQNNLTVFASIPLSRRRCRLAPGVVPCERLGFFWFHWPLDHFICLQGRLIVNWKCNSTWKSGSGSNIQIVVFNIFDRLHLFLTLFIACNALKGFSLDATF